MANILDHIPRTPLLEGVDYWPKSASREEWFALTRDLIASTIAEMGEYLELASLLIHQLQEIAAKGLETNQLGSSVAALRELSAMVGIGMHNRRTPHSQYRC